MVIFGGWCWISCGVDFEFWFGFVVWRFRFSGFRLFVVDLGFRAVWFGWVFVACVGLV